jgi:hypothetical protein
MHSFKEFLIYSVSFSLFASCATDYKGGEPNFALRGANFWIPYSAAIFILITQSLVPSRSLDQTNSIAFYSLLGVSVGFSIAAFNIKARAAEQFNKDLNLGFAPSFSYNFEF